VGSEAARRTKEKVVIQPVFTLCIRKDETHRSASSKLVHGPGNDWKLTTATIARNLAPLRASRSYLEDEKWTGGGLRNQTGRKSPTNSGF